MGYYMRFFVDDEQPVTLDQIQAGLKEIDPAFRLARGGDLRRGEQLLAQLEVNTRGDGLFDEEVGEFLERIKEADESERALVDARLRSAHMMVAAQVRWQGREPEETLDMLAPLWEWLTRNRKGLFQADGEGFYDDGELVVDLE